MAADTHRKTVGYVLWIIGFTGMHRFFYGRPISGTIWLLTGGLFLIGWIVDFFLIPGMDRDCDFRFQAGPIDYSAAWLLLAFFGYLGLHRFYIGKWPSGVLYLVSAGLFGVGLVYDLWTLNQQIDLANRNRLATSA